MESLKRYGSWALITGASAGIGKEFAHQLARSGLNLVLVARREAELQKIKIDLEQSHGINARTLVCDLTNQNALSLIIDATRDLEIGLLVNNAGIAYPGSFLKNSLDRLRKTVNLNSVLPMELAHEYGRQMASRGRGAIIFVSDHIAYFPVPYASDYAASKSFILNFGEALAYELKNVGVDVLVLSPGPTDTAMRKLEGIDFSKMPLSWMSASKTVGVALRSLGKTHSVVPGLLNKLMLWAFQIFIPRPVLVRLNGWMTKRALASDRL